MRIVTAVAAIGSALAASIALAQQHQHGAHQSGGNQHQMHGAPSADARMLVQFPPQMAEHTLANMRDHLLALQQINEALARGQNDKAGQVAEQRLGMSSLQLHGAHEVAKFMPQGMQDAGTAMHRAASRFALAAQNSAVTGDLKPAFGALAEVMNACVSCHAGYRLK